MQKAIIMTILIMSLNLFAAKPLLVNGMDTKGYKPVVKLNIRGYMVDDSGGLCTGTFIKAGYILTAAHCVTSIILENSNLLKTMISVPNLKRLRATPTILINDEKVSRLLGVSIHPVYEEAITSPKIYLEKLIEYEAEVKAGKLSLEEARLKFSDVMKGLKNEHQNSMSRFDIAILKVTPHKDDQIYKLGTRDLKVGEKVTMVGFGSDQTIMSNFRDQEEIAAKMAMARSGNSLERLYYANAVQSLREEYLSHNNAQKRVGYNEIEFSQDGVYGIVGTTKTAKTSWNSLTAYVYEWEEADGKDALISHGDSGGPLLVKEGNTYRVYGVVSRGEERSERVGYFGNINTFDTMRYINTMLLQ